MLSVYEADIDSDKVTNNCYCSICTNPALRRDQTGSVSASHWGGRAQRLLVRFREWASSVLWRCVVRAFGRGHIEQIAGDFVSIQLCTLDDPTPVELIGAPVRYANGREHSWWTEPAETRHV